MCEREGRRWPQGSPARLDAGWDLGSMEIGLGQALTEETTGCAGNTRKEWKG